MRNAGTADIGGASVRTGSGSGSLRALSVLVCVYGAGAALQLPWTFLALFVEYLTLALRGSLFAVAIGVLLAIAARPAGGISQILRVVGSRVGLGLAGLVLIAIGLAAFSTYKLLIPSFLPFVWDAPFDSLDRFLHGGAPWHITHAIIPVWLESVFGALYGTPWFLYWFGTMGFALFCCREPLRSRYLWALALTMALLGTVAATAFASHGPILFPHFGRSGYEDLAAALRSTPYGRDMLLIADYLYGATTRDSARFGSGISAMPSMHVAIVTLNFCFYASISRRLGLAAATFVVPIVIGSVHFGWHYALDAYASLLAVPLIWWTVGRVAVRRAPAPYAASTYAVSLQSQE